MLWGAGLYAVALATAAAQNAPAPDDPQLGAALGAALPADGSSDLILIERASAQTPARVLGATNVRIVVRHVLPQVSASIIVLSSLLVASMILFEASLSFLGLGVQPPTPSWGNMVLDGVEPIRVAWWVSFFPGLAILLTVMGINLFGDGLRDAFDPRFRRRG